MATWISHLRVTEQLLRQFDEIDQDAFIMGNIAPDSGVPNADWSFYVPSTEVSHFRDKKRRIQIDEYINQYFTVEKRKQYSLKEYSFFLGYLTHLMTDVLWKEQIAAPCIEQHPNEVKEGRQSFIMKMKKDWYDLDFLYLKKHSDFAIYNHYLDIEHFQNEYMEFFAKDAFERKQKVIAAFYRESRTNLQRKYTYLTECRANRYICETVNSINAWLKVIGI